MSLQMVLRMNVMVRQKVQELKGVSVKLGVSEPKLSQVEKSVIIRALQGDIKSEREYATLNPDLAPYAERNIKFREELIGKVESL